MTTGAIIAAAGVRDTDLRPILALHGTTFLRRIVLTLQKSSVSPIVIVAGENADTMRRQLSKLDVQVMQNDASGASQLMDTARLGWEALSGQCDRLFFVLGDVPLISPGTLEAMMEADAPLVIPVFREMEGHPLLAHGEVFRQLLGWEGPGGLREAARQLAVSVEYVPVEDEGILASTSTPATYLQAVDKALKLRSYDTWAPIMHLQLRSGKAVLDAASAAFLRALDRTGSVEVANEYPGLSADNAWQFVQRLEEALGGRLIENREGRFSLTPLGRDFVDRFERFAVQADQAVGDLFAHIFDVKTK